MGSLSRGSVLVALPVVATLVVGGVAGTLAGCSDDGGPAAPSDAGLVDSFPGDVGSLDDARPATGTAARLTVVNAAHDLGPGARNGPNDGTGNAPVRLCFLVGRRASDLAVANHPPLPAVVAPLGGARLPALEQGRAATLADTGIPYADRYVVPLVIASRSLELVGAGSTVGCADIIGSFGLTENIDYWRLPAIAPGTLGDDRSYLLVLTGCAADAETPNPGKCGPGYVASGRGGRGNLALSVLDPSGPAAPLDALGVRFLHASTAAQAVLSTTGDLARVHPGIVSGENGAFRPVTDGAPRPGVLQPLVSLTAVGPFDSLVFGSLGASPGSGEPLYPRKLEIIAQQTTGGGLGTASPYAPGLTFVFVALGDPDAKETPSNDRSGNPNPRAFHYLGLPAFPR